MSAVGDARKRLAEEAAAKAAADGALDWHALLGRKRCCEQDSGGSHYHCARCNGVTGMYGHYKGGEFRTGKWVQYAEAHMCCPDNCESPAAHCA